MSRLRGRTPPDHEQPHAHAGRAVVGEQKARPRRDPRAGPREPTSMRFIADGPEPVEAGQATRAFTSSRSARTPRRSPRRCAGSRSPSRSPRRGGRSPADTCSSLALRTEVTRPARSSSRHADSRGVRGRGPRSSARQSALLIPPLQMPQPHGGKRLASENSSESRPLEEGLDAVDAVGRQVGRFRRHAPRVDVVGQFRVGYNQTTESVRES